MTKQEIRNLPKEKLRYALGALLYCPGNNETIAENLISGKLDCVSTLVLCLEDAILPQFLKEATDILEQTLEKLKNEDNLPLLFIRVRDPKHLEEVFARFYKYSNILTGFVLPKFDTSVSEDYIKVMRKINAYKKFYYLPILESAALTKHNRREELELIKESIAEENILGILVGSNDLCSYYSLRRNAKQTVYDIGVVRDILVDIVAVFRKDYVINGPVWEFFDGDAWKTGLKREAELDKLNGFLGKACIHPKQIMVVNNNLRVNEYEYEDAMDLLHWDTDKGVKKSRHTGRMNEIMTNKTWAEFVAVQAEIYGIKY